MRPRQHRFERLPRLFDLSTRESAIETRRAIGRGLSEQRQAHPGHQDHDTQSVGHGFAHEHRCHAALLSNRPVKG